MKIQSNTPLKVLPSDYCPPGSERWFTLTEGHDAGKTLFYYDHATGTGEPEATVLMVHGNPECSYTYRHIRDSLTASGRSVRIIALDHIGFGISDQADFEMVDMHHARNLLQLVRHLDLQNLTLVVHDWGGPIGIGALIQEAWRVDSLLVMNTTVFPMPSEGITYTNYPMRWLPWSSTPHFVPNALWGGVAAKVVSHGEPQNSMLFFAHTLGYLIKHGLRIIPAGSTEYVWAEQLRSRANARSSKRNVLQTPVWGHGYLYEDRKHGMQDNRDFYRFIQSEVPRQWGAQGRNIPVSGFFGQWDACGKNEVIAQWHEALPAMKTATAIFPECGHFIEELKGPEMASAILHMNAASHSGDAP